MTRLWLVAFAAVLTAPITQAHAACMEGKIRKCALHGQAGTSECIGGRWERCNVEVPEPGAEQGTVSPKYLVLTVIYAPPGTEGGSSSSSVVYGSGSTTGSTVSSTGSFKQNHSVSVTAEAR